MILETERLYLRPLDSLDKEAVFVYRSLPEVYQFQAWKPENTNEVAEFIHKLNSMKPETPNTWLQLAICLKNGLLIGDTGIHFLEDGAQVEIGYTVSPAYQGNGYAFEAVKAMLGYVFNTLRKHRVTASVDPKNKRSINLLKKLKFRQEAHFVKSFMMNGEWTDDCVYALLAEEWV